jgi:iron-sulfur cluster insertion protein
MIIFEPTAIERIKEIINQENNPDVKLRIFVQGGGCSGFNYGFTLDEHQAEDDFYYNENDLRVLVDGMSAQYLTGATIKYKNDPFNQQFVIDNPNATSTCGCGSSFSI